MFGLTVWKASPSAQERLGKGHGSQKTWQKFFTWFKSRRLEFEKNYIWITLSKALSSNPPPPAKPTSYSFYTVPPVDEQAFTEDHENHSTCPNKCLHNRHHHSLHMYNTAEMVWLPASGSKVLEGAGMVMSHLTKDY